MPLSRISGNISFQGTSNRITGDMSNTTIANRVAFQTSTTNGSTTIMALPNGSGIASQLLVRTSNTATDDQFGQFVIVKDSELRIATSNTGNANAVSMTLQTSNIDRMRIAANGVITLNANSVVSLTSGQLQFPATQNASADPNTIDDYEEGTWTPSLTASGASGFTFLDQFGWYVKIGRSVSCFFRVNVNSLSSASGSGQVFVSGLPFTNTTGNGVQGVLSLIDATRWGSNFPTSGFVSSGGTQIALFRAIGTAVAGTDPTQIVASDLRTGSSFNGNTVQGSITYLAAS